MKLGKKNKGKKSVILRLYGYGKNQRRYANQKLKKTFIQQHREKMSIGFKISPIPTKDVIKDIRKYKAEQKTTKKATLKTIKKTRQKAICIQKGTWKKKPNRRQQKVAA